MPIYYLYLKKLKKDMPGWDLTVDVSLSDLYYLPLVRVELTYPINPNGSIDFQTQTYISNMSPRRARSTMKRLRVGDLISASMLDSKIEQIDTIERIIDEAMNADQKQHPKTGTLS